MIWLQEVDAAGRETGCRFQAYDTVLGWLAYGVEWLAPADGAGPWRGASKGSTRRAVQVAAPW